MIETERIIEIGKEVWPIAGPIIKGMNTIRSKFSGMFKPKSSLSGFEKGDNLIIFSSLYPRTMYTSVIKPIGPIDKKLWATPTPPPGPVQIAEDTVVEEKKGELITSPIPLTGIFDSFGLVRFVEALVKLGINFDLTIDPISEKDKKNNNLILFGGPSSNLVAREFYQQMPPTAEFEYGTDKITFQGTTYSSNLSGYLGHVIKYRNPWNENRQILWFAGLGAQGTEAAVRFITQEGVGREIAQNRYWIAIVEGSIIDGYVTEAQFRGGKSLA